MTRATPTGPTRLAPVWLEGDAGRIEALLQEQAGHEPEVTAVVCHPHPLYGGTLHNKVVHRVASTWFAMGVSVLRFNFRGVGGSEGTHDRGTGELEDARLALDWLVARHPHARRWVAGFSFGSWIGARLALAESAVERLLMVAPPVHTQDFSILDQATIPKAVIQGLADDICTPERLTPVYERWADPKWRVVVPGAGHFFDRKLAELGEAVRTAFPERL